jgi:type VI protein secretion system component VasK
VLASQFGVGQFLWDLVWFFLLVLWLILLFRVFGDIFRSHDMGGVAKAVWVIFVILMPFLGVLVYLIARGSKMAQHEQAAVQAQQKAAQQYIQQAAAPLSSADELKRLAGLRDKGVLSEEEFQTAKAKVLG